jgi:RNA polymerase sigma-70 factor (ECF subfamily)
LPEVYVIQEATRRHVVEVLGSIRPKYQKILIQRYIDGSRVGEIAKSIGKTYKATESLLSRARQAFKSSFIKLSKEERDE